MRGTIAAAAVGLALGCASLQRGESLDPASLPAAVRADYDVFANRCSRCHPLARPLNARVDDDEHWALYVARMRRMPGSGISPDDVPKILRFLSWWRRQREVDAGAPADGGRR